MAIANLDIQNTAASILTVPVGKTYVITTMMVVNTAAPDVNDDTAGATTLTVHIVSNGGVGDITNTNMVINVLPITAGETFVMDTEKLVLDAGDSFVLKGATPANLSATISYVDI
jgi:hypothetical protein|tara:strand:- start:5207 stop:5551 length:345 start_codon:yes stop_codon:yes gene_type:complete